MPQPREIHFHEDDYCQQQLLPVEAAGYVEAELRKIAGFAEAHRALGGAGWTDMYARKEAPAEFGALKFRNDEFARVVAAFLPHFDVVYTGYSSHRNLCKKTAAWGRSQQCALFADWDDDGIIANVWVEFFDREEESIIAATKAVAAIAKIRTLIYVDWAWGYICEAHDEHAFASALRAKLQSIANDNRNL